MHFDSIPSLAYLLPQAAATDVETAAEIPAGTREMVAIVLPEQATALADLRQRFPEGRGLRRYNRLGGELFDVWAVGRASSMLPSSPP